MWEISEAGFECMYLICTIHCIVVVFYNYPPYVCFREECLKFREKMNNTANSHCPWE